MRDFIGAPNRPFVTEYRKNRFQQAIKQKCCVVLENIPTDTTVSEINFLINYAGLESVDVFIPFNLVTQTQVNKAYVILKDCYSIYKLLVSIRYKVIRENQFRIRLYKDFITF